jgi:hypothetical protein
MAAVDEKKVCSADKEVTTAKEEVETAEEEVETAKNKEADAMTLFNTTEGMAKKVAEVNWAEAKMNLAKAEMNLAEAKMNLAEANPSKKGLYETLVNAYKGFVTAFNAASTKHNTLVEASSSVPGDAQPSTTSMSSEGMLTFSACTFYFLCSQFCFDLMLLIYHTLITGTGTPSSHFCCILISFQ